MSGGVSAESPRWSLGGMVTPEIELLPAPMAGLPIWSCMVSVSPP